jgi:hypothetical protein
MFTEEIDKVKQLFFIAEEQGYTPALDWKQDPRFLPSDMQMEQSIFLELCLIKQWLYTNHEIYATERWEGQQQGWDATVTPIKGARMKAYYSENVWDEPLPAFIDAIKNALEAVEEKVIAESIDETLNS